MAIQHHVRKWQELIETISDKTVINFILTLNSLRR